MRLRLLAILAAALVTGCESEPRAFRDVSIFQPRDPGSRDEPGDPADPADPACVEGFEDACFLRRFFRAGEIASLRGDPDLIVSLFDARSAEFREALGTTFTDLSDEGLALAFSATLAYEAMPYRTPLSTYLLPLSRNSAEDLLAPDVGLVCDEYVSLTTLLFYRLSPQGPASPVHITPIGWRSDSPFGNHAQAFATGTGVPFLLDPTYGFLARGTLGDLLRGNPLAVPSQLPARRVVYQSVQQSMRTKVSLKNDAGEGYFQLLDETSGRYRPAHLIYLFEARDEDQGGRVVSYAPEDFIATCSAGPGSAVSCLDVQGRVWGLDENATSPLEPDRTFTRIASRESDGLLFGLDQSGELVELSSGSTLATDVADIAEGLDGGAIYYMSDTGALVMLDASGATEVATATAIAEGQGGRALYYRTGAGELRSIDPSGDHSTGFDVSLLAPGRGAQSQGRSVYAIAEGTLLRTDTVGTWDALTGVGTALDQTAAVVRIGTSGRTLSLLTASGAVHQATVDAAGEITSWSEPAWFEGPPTAPFASIELVEHDFLLRAVQADGATRHAPASTY